MKPYLILYRAGPGSLHPHTIERLEQQNFDYALSWFGDEHPQAPGAVFVHMQKGPKYPGLERTLAAHWELISKYRYVWMPDDDLLCVPEQVSRMFVTCDDLQLELAQPALTPDSYFVHPITLQHAEFQLRFTNFVEIMAPVLSTEFLARVFPTLAGNISGYGLDSVWPRMSKLGRVAILDDVPVKHTRPLGGPNYKFNQQAGLTALQEDWITCASHFIDANGDFQINYGGLLQNGDAIAIGETEEEMEAMLQALLSSCSQVPVTALQVTRYLGQHYQYWGGGQQNRLRYPRSLISTLLERAVKPTGMRFKKPAAKQAAAAPVAAPVPAPAPIHTVASPMQSFGLHAR
ncbi:MAG TPA: hypothetical protein VLA61_05430 [Ideonella sp.]|uniref:hypothetical protein n=1 Tax=Ideonella sp. TaxID=1929293 RepID=UPI002C95228B|nr:hypothetical protein [Ideonella sp.]HSI47686.1 hypothetical protein [Ideonella sp.]